MRLEGLFVATPELRAGFARLFPSEPPAYLIDAGPFAVLMFAASNGRPIMPFAVLLEIALQPCGWLAAYVGSALTSNVDLSFRNLGGKAIQHQRVGPDIGRLTTRTKLTTVSSSGGMIIQHYEFAVRDSAGTLLMYVKQKMFKLKEHVQVFADEKQQQLMFEIRHH